LAVGETWNGENQDMALLKLSRGDLDSTFGINGIASTSILTSDDYCRSSAVQSDGKIIAAGNTIVNGFLNTGILIVRFNSNGAFDNTFGTNGIVSTKIGTYGGTANSIVIQPDGKIIAAGASSGFTLVRYLNDSVYRWN
jgi:uncharacterized delta-60 repeat protein